jgi:hypothetical protein
MASNKKAARADSKPDRDFNEINQLALKAQGLATQYASQIGNRLSAAFLASFAADITGLSVAVPATITSKGGQVQLTAAQAAALDGGYALVKGIRTTVKGHTADNDVLLAYGVGAKVNKRVVKEVTAALQTILNRIEAQPAEAASFDIVDEDVKAIKAALTEIATADQTQEAARAAGPQTTKDRNATARRLLDGVKKIAGAGMRAFVSDPTVYANFEALVSKKAG